METVQNFIGYLVYFFSHIGEHVGLRAALKKPYTLYIKGEKSEEIKPNKGCVKVYKNKIFFCKLSFISFDYVSICMFYHELSWAPV